ncbi:MAG: Two-component hybrid sensor and regulator [candidate division CPR2 bacterium GW2011_GWC1_39_9]|uniref:Two-component hybrid sensor and regulator n=1 Tax=candidate division CPR2 bacterium GW2011_GWC2_39_10 TaxID=1618345 RepID=A0A0G0Q0H0_UNCC2|nr:MAG: Two-component hybrid sensor and regulator [candidate division CPR2 bacterium GW2011_GWC2_39_10]KKR32628.1 MAG: Two-component hybrid sensor and regulator [candidate division CPR2 bacterium GW2011_GWC1_39_9]
MAKVLLVESDEGTRYLYKVAIAFQKIEVQEAENLDQAIELLKRDSYDLVLLDIMTADFDNLNIFDELKKAKDGIPVVIVSDLKNSSAMKHASILGACDYLVKSENTIGDIIKRVRSIVDDKAKT